MVEIDRTGALQMFRGRRTLLKGGIAILTLMGLPRALLAGAWPNQAFESTAASEALVNLLGTDRTIPSDEITLAAPLVAEDGSIVPISVATTLPDISCRIKMAETFGVMAVVQTRSGIFSASVTVK
jgi:sulfur-oxidizing protein SoxY